LKAILSHDILFLVPSWGQEWIVDVMFIDWKTEKKELKQVCPVMAEVI
jgi:hypothetical protein